jgi:uncharacterized repeat protein (TIGR01451 family)
LTWNNLGPLPAGGTQEVTIPVQVGLGVSEGEALINSASAVYKNAADYTFASKTASDTTVAHVPALTISKAAQDVNGSPLVVGDTIRYTLLVTNTGNYTAHNVTITDDLPSQVTCQATSGDSPPACADPLIWNLSSLAPDATATLHVDVTVNPGSEGQTIVNTASVTSTNVVDPPDDPAPVCPDGSQPVGGECPITPVPTATLTLIKSALDVNGPPLIVDDVIRYTLQVTNTSSYTAYNVTVTDDLPSGLTLVGTSTSRGSTTGLDPIVWHVGDLPSGGSGTLVIQVRLKPESVGLSLVNTGVVSASNVPDLPPSPQVCPDGSAPVGGLCAGRPQEPPQAPGTTLYFPLIRKTAR